MAYSNAIFYLDLYNGNDAARAALTSCIASNPSGTITRITKNGHGLVTGAVVTLSLFSAWLNGAWKITVIDSNSFDLDAAVWQATADNNGTVTPFGGSSWADAWKTVNAGPTTARTQAGDKIKVCKTSDPVSIGNAAWTNESKQVVLETAQTKTIDNCENLWTAANANVQVTREATGRREGNYCAKLNILAGFTTGKVGYYTLPSTLDLSAYQELSLWFLVYLNYTASNFYIALCSDATGDVIVDKFYVPFSMYTHFASHTLVKDGGGNLGSNINSIAVYATTDPGTLYVMLDNIMACKTGGFNLNHLISKNGASQGGDEPYWFISSIDETIINLGGNPYYFTNTWYGYAGVTENVETFLRMPFKALSNLNSSQVLHTVSKAGLEFEFGYDTITNELTGETFLGTVNSQSTAFELKDDTIFSGYLSLSSFFYGINMPGTQKCKIKLTNCISIQNSPIITSIFSAKYVVWNLIEIANIVACGSISLVGVFNSTIKLNKVLSNALDVLNIASATEFNKVIFNIVKGLLSSSLIVNNGSNNDVYGNENIDATNIIDNQYGIIKLFNIRATGASIVSPGTLSSYNTRQVRWINRDGNGSHEVYYVYAKSYYQTTNKYDTENGSLEFMLQQNVYSEYTPLMQKIADINFTGGTQVTVTTHIKKSNILAQAQLVIGYNPIVGIDADIKSTALDNTDWQEVSVQFIPNISGVAEVFIYTWVNGGNTNYYINIGKVEATQV